MSYYNAFSYAGTITSSNITSNSSIVEPKPTVSEYLVCGKFTSDNQVSKSTLKAALQVYFNAILHEPKSNFCLFVKIENGSWSLSTYLKLLECKVKGSPTVYSWSSYDFYDGRCGDLLAGLQQPSKAGILAP